MAVILYPYSDVRKADQRDSLLSLVACARVFGDMVRPVYMKDDDSYYRLLARYWTREEIVIIEQDIVVHPSQIANMLDCGMLACCHPYRVKSGDWSLFSLGPENQTLYYDEIPKVPFVEASGLGFVKIEREVQNQIVLSMYPVLSYKWWYLDTWLSAQMKMLDLQWHVHQPEVIHNRSKDET